MNKQHLSSKRAGSALGTVALYFAAIAAMLSSVMPARAAGLAAPDQQSPCRKIGDYSVCGRFIDEWNKQGSDQASVYVNGLPITAQRTEISVNDGKTYQTQWFERAKYELHPENKAPYDVLLGRLGGSLTEGRGIVDTSTQKVRNPSDEAFAGIDKPADADGKAKVWFPETKHSVSGKILEYWNRYGGLPQFGFPLSEPFQEVSGTDGKSYMVQYFERNRFELHPDNKSPYEVQLGLLGVQQYKRTPVPGDKTPLAPPVGVKSTKDTLVIGIPNAPPAIPALIDAVGGLYYDTLYSALIHVDDKGDYFPEMAWYVPTIENGAVAFVGSGDDRHLQITYKIRPGMKWSDGVEITSNDIVYGFKSAFDPDFTGFSDNPYFASWLYSVDNPDRYTVIANFFSLAQERDAYAKDSDRYSYLKDYIDANRPFTDMEYYRVMEDMLVPEHVLGKVAPKDQAALGYFSDPDLSVTSGPFKLAQFDQNQIVLVPNPYYTLTAPPLLKRIILRIIPDHDVLVAQLKSGDVDLASAGLVPADLDQLKKTNLVVKRVTGNVWERIDFNLDRPFFKEKAVRQAIAYAIDRQKIADQVSSGTWEVSHTSIPTGVWDSMQNPVFAAKWGEQFPLKKYDYNPALANQMLDQAGWLKGADGIRAKGGVRLSFNYETTQPSPGGPREQVQAMVKAYLKAVGVDAKPQMLSRGDFFGDSGSAGLLFLRDFDFAESASIFEPDASGFYDSGSIPTADNNYSGNNTPGYKNQRYDELVRQDMFEIDRSKRAPLVAEMQSIDSEDLPSLPLFVRSNFSAYRANLVNWDQSGWFVNGLYKACTLYFK